ncbi:hypothetical protein HMPREF1503_1641 [Olsenella uli MSTE5]|nr:hypothetical protein HMPREF1503_1641 [Olsenella uli MSTE5]
MSLAAPAVFGSGRAVCKITLSGTAHCRSPGKPSQGEGRAPLTPDTPSTQRVAPGNPEPGQVLNRLPFPMSPGKGRRFMPLRGCSRESVAADGAFRKKRPACRRKDGMRASLRRLARRLSG